MRLLPVLTEPQRVSRSPRPRRVIALAADGPASPGEESAAEFLARTPLFSDVDPELVKRSRRQSAPRRLAAGKWLFRQRDPADEMYIVRAGRLEAVDEAADRVIREYRRGDTLGELALLTDSPRSASVRAVRATEVIAVGRADFTELLRNSPALSLGAEPVAEPSTPRHAPAAPTAPAAWPQPTTVALIALDDWDPAGAARRPAGAALQAHLSVAVLAIRKHQAQRRQVTRPAGTDRRSTGRSRPRPGSAHRRARPGPALDEVLPPAGGPDPGGDRRWADLAALGQYPELQGCDLVAYDVAPGALRGWGAALNAAGSHLLRKSELCRHRAHGAPVAGASVGIVLSGGGARAFSHIGVLEELTPPA